MGSRNLLHMHRGLLGLGLAGGEPFSYCLHAVSLSAVAARTSLIERSNSFVTPSARPLAVAASHHLLLAALWCPRTNTRSSLGRFRVLAVARYSAVMAENSSRFRSSSSSLPEKPSNSSSISSSESARYECLNRSSSQRLNESGANAFGE